MTRDNRHSIRRRIRRDITWDADDQKPKNTQAHILAGLNVLRVLEDKVPAYMQNVLHYGPKTHSGKHWASAVVWYRKKGFNTYQFLTLFGVWAVQQDDVSVLQIGTKELQFSAAVYNAESYNQLIKRDFKTYYADTGSPPAADSIMFSTPYDKTRRLALRREIEDAIVRCLRRLSL